ncbi:hypothetical protein [Nocardia sp. NPDC048505]|uniref:hypothetical protein n=1 Tax=unclassified Nocardia TaxID=2637762 RepID=UPI0033F8395C
MSQRPNEFLSAVRELEIAVRSGIEADMYLADDRMRSRYDAATPEDLAEAGPVLAGFLGEVPLLARAQLAVLVGACVENGADPVACAPRILAYLAKALESAREFATEWSASMEIELPDPEQDPEVPFEQLADAFGSDPVMAWWSVPYLERAGLAMLQHAPVRTRLGPIRGILRERCDAYAQQTGRYDKCLDYVLRVLDEEPLVVLDRNSGTGFQMRMSGLGDNFQLHTLLADALIGGGHLPGEPPTAEAVAACRDAPGMTELTRGAFTMFAPDGERIWNEGTPSDIPVIEGARLLILEPIPIPHTWPAGRFFPYMTGDLTMERPLTAAEATRWFDHVRVPEPSA